MKGIVTIRKNGLLLVEEDFNDIGLNLKNHLNNYPITDQAIDNLFTTRGEVFGGTMDALDGILVGGGFESETMETTQISASGGNARKWKGIWTAEGGGYTGVENFAIGHNFNAAGSAPGGQFEVTFATYNITSIDVDEFDVIEVEWEIIIDANNTYGG